MQPSDPTLATPLPAPDPMDEVVGRVRGYMDSFKDDLQTPEERQAYEDVSALLAAYQSVRESGPMFQLLTGERVMLHGCRIIADKDVPQDEAHIYDHRGNLPGRITGLTARRTGGTE